MKKGGGVGDPRKLYIHIFEQSQRVRGVLSATPLLCGRLAILCDMCTYFV